MFSDDTRQKLKNIVSGIIIEEQTDTCTAVRNILCASFSTSTTVKKDFESKSIVKEEQVGFLKNYCANNNLWVHDLPGEDTHTPYTFLGFAAKEHSLQAVLSQPFIASDALADLADVKKLLAFNGFENTRRNDYLNKELGLILEDMHDENVIVNSDTLFFIDTVFYTISGETNT
ncbi:MAG: hypothetical protein J7621_21745 [Niastella sp.]|nr:hypothetical protein [Niastella sp.]